MNRTFVVLATIVAGCVIFWFGFSFGLYKIKKLSQQNQELTWNYQLLLNKYEDQSTIIKALSRDVATKNAIIDTLTNTVLILGGENKNLKEKLRVKDEVHKEAMIRLTIKHNKKLDSINASYGKQILQLEEQSERYIIQILNMGDELDAERRAKNKWKGVAINFVRGVIIIFALGFWALIFGLKFKMWHDRKERIKFKLGNQGV